MKLEEINNLMCIVLIPIFPEKQYGKMNGEIFHRTDVAMACLDGQVVDAEQIMEGCLIED